MFIVLPLLLLLAGVCSYFIAARLYRQLVKKRVGSWQSLVGALLTFATCFILIMVAIFLIYFTAVPFGR